MNKKKRLKKQENLAQPNHSPKLNFTFVDTFVYQYIFFNNNY